MNLKKVLTVCGILAMGAIPSFANVSGSPLQDYGNLDGCLGCIFPVVQFGSPTFGQHVTSYSFYAGTASGPTVASNVITPLLFEQTSLGHFTIRGIGNQSTGFTDNAINTESFVLASGLGTVLDGNTFFGYVDGTANGNKNRGTISMNYPAATGPVSYFSDPVGALFVGQSLAFTSLASIGQGTRTYALDVTTTPEPAFYGLLGLGLAGIAAISAGRRRKSA